MTELQRKIYHNLPLSESELNELKKMHEEYLADPDFEPHDYHEPALKLKLEVFKCRSAQLNTRRELKLVRNFKKILGLSISLLFIFWFLVY